eukprot:NODE_77_length_23806_cov_0.393892.p8 type:complete len:202 gc:universal NODE_77_length_23806_cov_0.393892:9013-9618(+)
MLSQFCGQRFFSKIDCRKGYWQMLMNPADVAKTTFVTHRGVYRYLKMPFGLKNAGKTFQRAIDFIFRPLLDKEVMVYPDDIIVMTETEERHLEVLNEVMRILESYNVKTGLQKCKFMLQEIDYLGFLINTDGVRPDPARIQPIVDYPRPQTVKQIKTFLGMVSFYRGHIHQFADKAVPLYNLLKKMYYFIGTRIMRMHLQI